jgi:hypothetical protein
VSTTHSIGRSFTRSRASRTAAHGPIAIIHYNAHATHRASSQLLLSSSLVSSMLYTAGNAVYFMVCATSCCSGQGGCHTAVPAGAPLTALGACCVTLLCVHAVGGVMGFALVYKGASAVIWAGRTASFPYYTGNSDRLPAAAAAGC